MQQSELNIKEAIADRGYGAINNIKSLNENSITTYIPLFSSRSGKKALEMKEAGFIYDKENDKYICPEGQEMLPVKNKDMGHYHSKAHVCNICPTQNQCSALHKKSGQRIIHRSWDQELFEQEINRMKEPIFHRKLRERMWKIEGIFSEAKNIHGLSRAKYRGLKKMQIQAHMTSATQNLKRLITRLISTFITALLQRINFEFWKFMICIIKYKISNSFFYIRGIKYI